MILELMQFTSLPDSAQKVIKEGHLLIEGLGEFQKLSKPSTFEFLFGVKEGERLWDQFVRKTDSNIFEMISKNYLSQDQYATLFANVYMNMRVITRQNVNMLYCV